MCDIVALECEGCKQKVDVHIGDFSCSREAVYVWCPHCFKKAVAPEGSVSRIEEMASWSERTQMWEGGENHGASRRWTKMAVLFCTDPRGHDIHLN